MTVKLGIALSVAALSLGATAVTAEARPRETGQQQLDRLLEGRVAGKPVSCLPAFANDQVRIIDRTALVYGSGSTIYVNRPRDPSNLDDDDILVSRRFGNQVCKLDMVRLHDRGTQTFSGFVNLEDFVPYRRVDTARR
jgi:hypothetical protein